MIHSIQLEIRRPNKEPKRFGIWHGIYTIGRDDDCKIRLAHDDVEGRHAILTLREEGAWLEDLGSKLGTTINGKKIKGRVEIQNGQEIGIGSFVLLLDPRATPPKNIAARKTAASPKPLPEPSVLDGGKPEDATPSAVEKPAEPAPASAPPAPAPLEDPPMSILEQKRSIKQQIHKELVQRLDLKRLVASRVDKEELRRRASETIGAIVEEVSGRLPPGIAPELLTKEICDEALALGPLEDFLADPSITEIMVNGPSQIYVERNGRLELTDKSFMDANSVLAVIERIVSPIGRRIDESQPYVDARLKDGSRVNAIIHPLSLVGPCVTIRKFSKDPFTTEDLVRFQTLTPSIAEFISVCVQLRRNIVVSGGTGSGKTTLLNVLSSYLPANERILTIEDAAELKLNQEHLIRLEARPPNIEGKGAVSIRDLVRNALRMRPDRIVIGECRGGEALDMLQAMNTGHDGSLTTIHANSPRDVIARLETMVLMSGMDLPIRAIREQISAAIHVIVHTARFSDGKRKVTKVTEIVGQEGDQITMQDIFEFEQTGVDANGSVVGAFKPTGSVPTFIEEVQARGLAINRTMFDPMQWKE